MPIEGEEVLPLRRQSARMHSEQSSSAMLNRSEKISLAKYWNQSRPYSVHEAVKSSCVVRRRSLSTRWLKILEDCERITVLSAKLLELMQAFLQFGSYKGLWIRISSEV